jgi:uncharacterized protein involved in cysteine biosynthesis
MRTSSSWSAFADGLTSPWQGLRWMAARPRLWRYGWLPILANLLITGLIFLGLIAAGYDAFLRLSPDFGAGWGQVLIGMLLVLVLASAVLAGVFLAWVVLQGLLCDYFYGKLAERVERELGITPGEIRSLSLRQTTADTFHEFTYLAGASFVCLSLQCLPPIGTIVGWICGYYFLCLTLGMNYLNFPLSFRGWRRAEKREFARRHRAPTLGLGTAVALMTFIPLLNAILLTTAVVGAVLLYRKLGSPDSAAQP